MHADMLVASVNDADLPEVCTINSYKNDCWKEFAVNFLALRLAYYAIRRTS